jgi:hypothetical protein
MLLGDGAKRIDRKGQRVKTVSSIKFSLQTSSNEYRRYDGGQISGATIVFERQYERYTVVKMPSWFSWKYVFGVIM